MAAYQEIMPFTKHWLWDVWYMFIRRAWQLSLKCEHSLWEQSVKERERQGLRKDREKRDRVLKEREMGMEWCLPTTTTTTTTTTTSSSPGSVDKHEELSCFSFTLYVGWMAGSATHRTSYGGFPPSKELYKYQRNLHTHTESYYLLHGDSSICKTCPCFSFTMWLYHCGATFLWFLMRPEMNMYIANNNWHTEIYRKKTLQANVKEIWESIC